MANDAEEMKLEPPHPGEYIREDILPELKMQVTELAAHLGVSRVALSELINEKRAVSTARPRTEGTNLRFEPSCFGVRQGR